jgi:hypothetical protein
VNHQVTTAAGSSSVGAWLTIAWSISCLAYCLVVFGPFGFKIAFATIVAGGLALFVNRPILSLTLGPLVWFGFWIVIAPPMISYRWAGELSECGNNLYRIGLAIQRYEDEHGHSPAAFLVDADGRPMHSWRVLILPYLEKPESRGGSSRETYADVHARYRFDEPWDSPHNTSLAELVDAYQCPSHRKSKVRSPTATSYLAVVGETAFWPGATPRKLAEVPDGMARTVRLIEANPIDNWMEPKDLSVDQALDYLASDQSEHEATTSHTWRPRPLPRHVLFADGHTELAHVNQPRELVATLLIGNDGKPDRHGDSLLYRPRPPDLWLQFVLFFTLAAIPWFVPIVRRIAGCIARRAI